MHSRTLSLGAFRGEMDETYAAPETIAALETVCGRTGGPEAEVLADGRNRVVAMTLALTDGGAADVVVKEFRSRGIDRLKSLVRLSKGERAWRGARALAEAGFGTPFPIAWLERRTNGFVAESLFVSERVREAREIRDVFRETRAGMLEPVLTALGREIAAVHGRGILHRDLSDGNVLVRETDGAVRFFFLDTNRIRLRRTLGAGARAKNLVRLGIPPENRLFFLVRYAEAWGCPLRRGFVFRYNLSKTTFTMWIRLKKALRLKKIARKLKIQ